MQSDLQTTEKITEQDFQNTRFHIILINFPGKIQSSIIIHPFQNPPYSFFWGKNEVQYIFPTHEIPKASRSTEESSHLPWKPRKTSLKQGNRYSWLHRDCYFQLEKNSDSNCVNHYTYLHTNTSGSVGWNQSRRTYRQQRGLLLSTFLCSFLRFSCIIRNTLFSSYCWQKTPLTPEIWQSLQRVNETSCAFLPKSYAPPPSGSYINTSILKPFSCLAVIT